MLSPDDRQTLLEALRPPPGYALGCAVGTTYSLQLDAALTAPAAFALYAALDEERNEGVEALELLESIRRHADRFTIFFQAGQAAVPRQRRLFAFLEQAVVPVTAPLDGVFHPKVWALRFDAPAEAPVFRALCASRNLTYDRSWDTLLRLDSAPDDADDTLDGADLARFVGALPRMAVVAPKASRREEIERLAGQLASVRWAPPPGVTGGRFHALGLEPGQAIPFPAEADRFAVISPFLSSGLLRRLPAAADRSVLVSRPQEIAACAGAAAERFSEAFVLDPDASPTGREMSPSDRLPPEDPGVPYEGLHAKLFVLESARHATLLTGSANATHAAFHANVEMLVELRGPAKLLGVDALLAEPGQGVQTLKSFLLPFDLDGLDAPREAEGEEATLDAFRRTIAARPLVARAGPAGDDGRHRLSFRMDAAPPEFPDGVAWRTWPITLAEEAAHGVRPGEAFEPAFNVSFEGITAFLANELSLGGYSTRFVLPADLVEAPANRATKLLTLLIGDSERFLRFLLMLLADDALDRYGLSDMLDTLDQPREGAWGAGPESLPLLEALLRTLARDPERLDHVEHLIETLQAEPDGAKLLPPGLMAIWAPIRSAARERRA